jgi:hypothetical protein
MSSLGTSGAFTADGPGEFWCDVCDARCTRSPEENLEFGHLVGCPERPDEINIGTKDGRRYRGPEESDLDVEAEAESELEAES